MTNALFSPLTIAGISHHSASAAQMEEVRFSEEAAFLSRAVFSIDIKHFCIRREK